MKKHQGSSASGGKPSIEDLPILQFSNTKSEGNNYFDFKRAIEVYAVQTYGNADVMFEKFEHYTPARSKSRRVRVRDIFKADRSFQNFDVARIIVKKCFVYCEGILLPNQHSNDHIS